ncbi:MAG: transcription-repair coupling factor, partial [Actinobacteria bacterium]|nr:transcription-repair coupling factor [Actinomycetota bacterium]
MTLSGLLRTVVDAAPFRAIAEIAGRPGSESVTVIAPRALQPFVAAALAAPSPIGAGMPLLIAAATGREAEDLATSLRALLPDRNVVVFPSWETLPHERLSPSSDTVGRRVAILRRLAHPDSADRLVQPVDVVVASIRAILQPMAAGLGDVEPVRLTVDSTADLTETVQHLVDMGYDRVDLVERRGQLAVRGGILDVFPPAEEHPLRVEFWGDSVEEIRSFAVTDQRSLELAPDGVFAAPVRELLLTPEVRDRARRLAEGVPVLSDMCEQLAQGICVEGMEALTPVLVGSMTTLLEVM